MSSTPTPEQKTHIHDKFTNWERQMEEKISARLQQFETAQQQKLEEFAESMQRSFSSLLETATEKFQQGLQPQLDQMASTMAQMQNVVLDRLNNLAAPSVSTQSKMPTMAQQSVSSVPMHFTPTYNPNAHTFRPANVATHPAQMACSSPGDKSE